jgi:hypothetical protein
VKTKEDLRRWVDRAEPGEVVVYHRGNNCLHSEIATQARIHAQRGDIALFQKRVSEGFEYRAMRLNERLGKIMRPEWETQ